MPSPFIPLSVLLLLTLSATAQPAATPLPADVFSSPLVARLQSGFGACGSLFKGEGAHMAYSPPRRLTIRSRQLRLPSSAFSLNGASCDSDPAAVFVVSVEPRPLPRGSPPNPFPGIIVDQFLPGELRYIYYGWPDTDGAAKTENEGLFEGTPQCSGAGGQARDAFLKDFGILRSAVDKRIVSPTPRAPPIVYYANATYLFVLFRFEDAANSACTLSSEGLAATMGMDVTGGATSATDDAAPSGASNETGGRGRERTNSSLSVGAISGIVAGVIVLVVVFGIMLTLAHRAVYRRRHSDSGTTPTGSEPPSLDVFAGVTSM